MLDRCAEVRRFDFAHWLLNTVGPTDMVLECECECGDGNANVIFAGDVEFNGSAILGALIAGGHIVAEAIEALGDVRAGGFITAGKHITADGNIAAGGRITAFRSITASGDITAGGEISLEGNLGGRSIAAQGRIAAVRGNISASGGISSGDDMFAEWGIKAKGDLICNGRIRVADGDVSVGGDLHVAHTTTCRNLDAAQRAVIGGSVVIAGSITGGHYEVSRWTTVGAIAVTGDFATENIVSRGDICVGGSLRSGEGICAHGAIRAGSRIDAKWSIRAGADCGIFAGLSASVSRWETDAAVSAAEEPANLMCGYYCGAMRP